MDNTTVARPYAKAAFDSALETNSFAKWSSFLQMAAFISSDPAVIALLKNPLVSEQQLEDLYLVVCAKDSDEQTNNFIKLLALRRRLHALPEMAAIFETLRAEHEKIIKVDIASFKPLDETQKQKLQAALKQRLKREIDIHCRVDESLIGGAVISAGDIVIDGSLRSQLKKLRRELIT